MSQCLEFGPYLPRHCHHQNDLCFRMVNVNEPFHRFARSGRGVREGGKCFAVSHTCIATKGEGEMFHGETDILALLQEGKCFTLIQTYTATRGKRYFAVIQTYWHCDKKGNVSQ